MAGHGSGSLAVTLALLQPSIKLPDMLFAVFIPMQHRGIGCFDESPLQIVVGLHDVGPSVVLPPLECTLGTSPA